MSELKTRFVDNNVRFVGIGLEEVGVEDFVKGEFFKGELYIDTKKQSYKALGFRKLGIFSALPSIFGAKARKVNDEVKRQKIEGDLKGDGFQNGGTLVVDKGGKLLFSFKQENAADHPDNEDILKALGLPLPEGPSEGVKETPEGAEGQSKPSDVVCEDDVCKKA